MKTVSIFLVTIALIAGMVGCGGTSLSQNLEIRTWYDLDAIRDNLGGNYILMNDLDSTTAGYEELASLAANGGKGWQPIYSFTWTFDGQAYEISDLFINRPGESLVGLFGCVNGGGVIKDTGVVDVTVSGNSCVGGLVGINNGTVSNSYSTGNVTGNSYVGGLVGINDGTVSNSYSTGNVTGLDWVGGLVGVNYGTMSNSYSTGSMTGNRDVGGLVGWNQDTMSNSYSTGSVTGLDWVGGLVGVNYGTMSNSYSTGNVTGNWVVGGLVGWNQDTVSDSYSTGNVTGLYWVGGMVGWNDAGTMSNSYSTGNVTGNYCVVGLVGGNMGDVSDSFWDTETSGQAISDGGTGKNTTEMKDITTFSGAAWDMIAIANPSTRNPSYNWNIVDDETYPFLSWQP